MKKQHHRRRLVALAVIAGLAVAGCAIPLDDLSDLPDGGLDHTKYGGLEIIGELTIGDAVEAPGPQDIDWLQMTMLSECFDQLITNGDEMNALHSGNNVCGEWVLQEPLTNDDGTECVRKFCQSELYRCLAFKNMELAEAVSVQHYESVPFAFDVQETSAWASFVYLNQSRGSTTRSYRIPPIPAESKTIPLRAAQAAFRMSGVQAALALQQEWDVGTGVRRCTDHLVNHLPGGPYDPDPTDMLVVGLLETMAKFGEATQKAIENELNVASSRLSTSPDYAAAQELLWNGQINSHASAVDNLVSSRMLRAEKRIFGTCSVPLVTPAHKTAVKVLRHARLLGTFELDPSSADYMSDSEIAQKASDKIYGELFRNINPAPPIPDVDTFLSRNGISLSDIAIARRYLLSERDALQRVNLPDESDPTGERGFGFSSRAFQHPPGFHLSINPIAGAWCSQSGSAEMCGLYATDGAAQTVDYLKEVVDNVLHSEALGTYALTDTQKRTLALPFTRKSLWGSIVTPEGVALTHQLQRSVSLPHDLMAWRRIIFTTEVAAELRHQPHRAA